MCGIVGYVGNSQAAPILLEGLSKLEYRGYDSAGLAVRDGEKLAEVVKAAGKLKALYEKIDGGHALAGNCGIGHTRWATHVIPSLTNAHPHDLVPPGFLPREGQLLLAVPLQVGLAFL